MIQFIINNQFDSRENFKFFFLVILYLILKIQELFRKICKYFEIRIYGGSECLMNYVHEVQSYQLILFQEHKINLPFIFLAIVNISLECLLPELVVYH